MRAKYSISRNEVVKEYGRLREEALKEIGVDVMRQTAAIFLYSLKLSGKYSDDELGKMYDDFCRFVNTREILGKIVRTNETTDYAEKVLGLDLDKIQPTLR